MEYQYKFTPLAVSDIDDALDYIANVLFNKFASDKLFCLIENEISAIRENPFSYPDCSYYMIDDTSLRHAVIGNYELFFEIREKEKTINILRFLYGKMDITNISIKAEDF